MAEPEYRCYFRCFHGCSGQYDLDDILYRCPQCGGLLEVWHDVEQLKRKSGAEWRALFEARWRAADLVSRSGVWSKKEWVHPLIADDHIVSLGEGYTPLVPSRLLQDWLGCGECWIKLCGISQTGSFKDLGLTVLVSQVHRMRARGRPIRAVACASTGDTSAALAAYCAAAGIPAVVLLPEAKVSTAQLIQPLAHGALTLSLQTDFDGCMALVQELTRRPEIYLANSMNPLRLEGQKTLAVELCQQMAWRVPDWVVVPGGNLGNISAIGRGFELALELGLIHRMPRLVCAQAEQANPLYESYVQHFRSFAPKKAGETLATAIQIGNPVSAPRAIAMLKKHQGIVEQASEAELAEAMAMADRAGFFVCPHTGVALAAAKKLADRGEIAPQDSVVIISTAHGLKFTETKQRLHTGKLEGLGPGLANQPVSLPATLDAVLEAIDRHFPLS